MLETLDTIPWDSLPQPSWNRPGEVPQALRDIATCSTGTQAQLAYSRFLFAVGNDHAGTYCPIVLAAIPFLGEILQDGEEQAQTVTLDILVDLLGSFAPEPEFEFVDGINQNRERLAALLYRKVKDCSGPISQYANTEAPPGTRERLAAYVFELLQEGEPQ
jgi:hypothetical protein